MGYFALKVRTKQNTTNELVEKCTTSDEFKKGFHVYLYNEAERITNAWDSDGRHLHSFVGRSIARGLTY